MSRLRSSLVGKVFLIVLTVAMLDAIDVLPVSLIRQAHARIGRPLTPVSYAGVRRRTARRSVCAATAVTVAASSAASSSASAQAAAAQQQAEAEQQAAIAEQQAAIAQQQAAVAQQQAVEAQRQAAAVQESTPRIQLPMGTVLPSLPQGCESVTISGAPYFRSGGTWMKPALSGGQIVYMVVADPS